VFKAAPLSWRRILYSARDFCAKKSLRFRRRVYVVSFWMVLLCRRPPSFSPNLFCHAHLGPSTCRSRAGVAGWVFSEEAVLWLGMLPLPLFFWTALRPAPDSAEKVVMRIRIYRPAILVLLVDFFSPDKRFPPLAILGRAYPLDVEDFQVGFRHPPLSLPPPTFVCSLAHGACSPTYKS